jgi:MFS family permease
MLTRLNPILYLISGLTDFIANVVYFTVTRDLAEEGAEPQYLGIVGGGLAFSAGVGSLLGGWLAHRFGGKAVFLAGAATCIMSIAACSLVDPSGFVLLPAYWLMGIGLGFVFPPLVGWLNQDEDPHANRVGVSRTLIIYCVAWNVGMMCGQLTAGYLFEEGAWLSYSIALAAAILNYVLAVIAVRRVSPVVVPGHKAAASGMGHRQIAAAFKRMSWLTNIGSTFGASMVFHLLPGLMVSIGVSSETHGGLLAGWRAIVIGTYFLMHHAAFWHFRLSTALASQVLAACGFIVIACADSGANLSIGLLLTGQFVGYNYFSSVYYSTAGSSHEGRALAAGINEATLAAGMALGTIGGGIIGTRIGTRSPYVMAAGVLVCLMVVQMAAWRVWVHPLRRSRPD